jgi:lipopolysaccharide biosynthesis glycosyltransferase
MEKNLLLIGASEGYAFSIGTLVLNLISTSPGTFQKVAVLADGLTVRDKQIISSQIPTEFISYKSPLSKKAIRRSPYIRFFTPHVLAKLESLRFLEEFDTVTWLDNDVLIVGRLDRLTIPGESGASFISTKSGLRGQLLRPIPGFQMDSPAPAGGTFMVSRKLPSFEGLYRDAIDFAEEFSRWLYLPDQAALGMAFQNGRSSWDALEESVWAPHPRNAQPGALIHHPYGPKKFWSGTNSADWNRHYRKWVEMGGSPMTKMARWKELHRVPVKLEIRFQRVLGGFEE